MSDKHDELDPNGLDAHADGAKLDANKPDMSLLLLFSRALRDVAVLGGFGARKYTRGGWQHVDNANERYTSALLRHLVAEQEEEYDQDSNVLHATAVAWNALARLELMLRDREAQDDIPIGGPIIHIRPDSAAWINPQPPDYENMAKRMESERDAFLRSLRSQAPLCARPEGANSD